MTEHRDYERRVASSEEERLAVASAKLAVIDALADIFSSFGINKANSDSMEEFKESLRFLRLLRKRPELWQDLDFLHSLRAGSIKAWSRFALALITIFAGGVAWAIITIFKTWLNGLVAGH
jgi:hypothetical protein